MFYVISLCFFFEKYDVALDAVFLAADCENRDSLLIASLASHRDRTKTFILAVNFTGAYRDADNPLASNVSL